MTRNGSVLIALLLLAPTRSFAQDPPGTTMPAPQHVHAAEEAPELFPLRDASGTAWLPDDSPMYGVRRTWRGWDVMMHGIAFGQVLYEPADRHRTGGFSKHQLSSVNWGMLMARRAAGAGRVGLRGMVSLEPWTVRHCGFINFLASGEICERDTIHDRQHPHDLFMELAADYDRPLRGSLRWQLYGGLAGEPAIGPPAFPHRVSAELNPIASISHHWLDSSHISYGLVTAGLYDRRWKAEMSLFNGREPDENRADLDLAPLDSVSGRVWFMPGRRIALQVSAAHLRESEAEFPPLPRADVNRATASATYHRSLDDGGIWATTLAFGANSGREFTPTGPFDAVTLAALVESSLTIHDRHTWFGRAELVEKPAHDLHAEEFDRQIFKVGKLQMGYVRNLAAWKALVPGIGATISASLVPPLLAPRYGGRVAFGFGVFVTARPSRHVM